MRVSFGRSLMFVAAVAMIPAAASAEDKKSTAKDPNRVICEKQEILGSRLQTKRVCMTAAEWSRKRLEDRQTIDRAQSATQRPTGG